jgi:hypothetical protein
VVYIYSINMDKYSKDHRDKSADKSVHKA